jgi:hypothetical protein
MSKLLTELDKILADATTTEKVAADTETKETPHASERGGTLRKLAASLRTMDTNPSYEDLSNFLGGVE